MSEKRLFRHIFFCVFIFASLLYVFLLPVLSFHFTGFSLLLSFYCFLFLPFLFHGFPYILLTPEVSVYIVISQRISGSYQMPLYFFQCASLCFKTKQRIHWISPFSYPRTSVISMVRLDLSLSLDKWMIISNAEEICWRIANWKRQSVVALKHHCFQSTTYLVELAGRKRTVMSGIHSLQHIKCPAPRTSPTTILSGRIRKEQSRSDREWKFLLCLMYLHFLFPGLPDSLCFDLKLLPNLQWW